MKHKFIWAVVIVILAVGILAACAQTADTPSTDKSEAETLIDERCSVCHSASKVYAESLNQEEWSDVFDDMIAKGADVSEAEKAIMIDWLVSEN